MSIGSALPGMSRLVRSTRVADNRPNDPKCHTPGSGGMPMTTSAGIPEVEVGPFWVSDSPRDELVDRVVDLCRTSSTRPAFAYALHVGGLNARRERDFVVAMRQADVVYADGGSVVWLARLAGGQRVERAPTTDIGWDIMRSFARKAGRIPRVALIGGPPGLAERAGTVLEEAGVADVVFLDNGFHHDWSEPLAAVACGGPGHHGDRSRRTPRDDLEPAPPRRPSAGTRPDMWRLVRAPRG